MTTEITQEQAVAIVASYRTDVDRYRDRARSVATLLATASGALAAGLVFSNVGQAFPTATKAAGYGGICILAVSVCFFLSASLYSLKDSEDSDDTFSPRSVLDFVKAFDRQTRDLVRSIRTRTKWGQGLGLGALGLLLLMVPLSIMFPTERLNVSVQMLEQPSGIRDCPGALADIRGSVSSADLTGTSPLLPVEVAGELCGDPVPAQTRTLYFQRSKVLIATARNP